MTPFVWNHAVSLLVFILACQIHVAFSTELDDQHVSSAFRRVSLRVNPFEVHQAEFQDGRTFDSCFEASDCTGDRSCTSLSTMKDCTQTDDFCVCLPRRFTLCSKKSDCVKKETCAHSPASLHPICVSKLAEKTFVFIQNVEKPIVYSGKGRSLDACKTTEGCLGERSCSLPTLKGFSPCKGASTCLCVPTKSVACFADRDCEEGEVCTSAPISKVPVCISKNAAERLKSVAQISSAPSQGYTLGSCRKDSECQRGLTCQLFRSSISKGSCKGATGCACAPPKFPKCAATSDCGSEGEMCAQTVFAKHPTCVWYETLFWNSVMRLDARETCPVKIKLDFPSKSLPEPLARISSDEKTLPAAIETNIQQVSRIIGGGFVSPNLFPYLALVTDQNQLTLCSGTLVSPRWVITAAHCRPEKGGLVALGTPQLDDPESKYFQIKKAFINPGYNQSTFTGDIAVVELEDGPLESSLFMQLNEDLSLPKDDSYVRSIGYGLSSNRGIVKDKFQFSLKQVDVPVVSDKVCSEEYGSLQPPLKIVEKEHVCSGPRRGGCGTCNGDSGGPQITYVNGKPVLIGITSFGVRCSFPKYPSVSARVSAYIPWLKSTGAVFYTQKGVYGEDSSKCKPGEFAFAVSKTVRFCRACPPDSVSKGGAATRCDMCPDGMSRDDRNGAMCSCRGKYSIGKGMKDGKCVKCAPGSFSGVKESTCKPCPKGTVASEPGSEMCLKCAKGFAPAAGATKCKKK